MSIVLSAMLVCAASFATGNVVGGGVLVGIGILVIVVTSLTEHDAHIRPMREAFRYLEREYRALLEEPK